MSFNIRDVKDMTDLVLYFSQNLDWNISIEDFDDIEDISYDFDAEEIGLKEDAFAKISSLRQLQPLVDNQKWGIFCVEFDSIKFEISALRKILFGLIPKRRNSVNHMVWNQQDLLFICIWGKNDSRTIGIAHFEEKEKGLPQIKMISCAPELEDFTQINVFEERLSKLMWPRNTDDIEAWRKDWSEAFVLGYHQTIQDSSTLAIHLAMEAQNIRNRILDILSIESLNGYVHLLYGKFKNTLIHDMTEQQFADMYAQTVVYGLFSARCMDKAQDKFSVIEAIKCIPSTNPFLKSLMEECLGTQNNSKLSFDELEIGNVVELLLNTKTEAIIQDFNRQTGWGREDPVIHFYEEFLSAYDKSQKVQRGVYYTPQPVVNFMVRTVDCLLKTQFDLKDGLASIETKKIQIKRESKRKIDGYIRMIDDVEEVPAIQVLDPATGTGTFIRQVILQIYDSFCDQNKAKSKEELHRLWNLYVDEHLLPRINGFELMMAPYAVAHMKLALVLKDTGYEFKKNSRLNVYLTNALEKAGSADMQIRLGEDPLAMESKEANGVKKNSGINIVIGNPPYSTESSNKLAWIGELMESYKKEADGKTKLREKNSKPLNDDYVKFIRYGQYILEHTNQGILAFITPHGFLDGPIYRGMRTSLINNTQKIYILDLHGNANRQEICPDGNKDENVFEIKQGVCIIFLIKKSIGDSQNAMVYRSDLWGTRDYKYDFLNKKNIDDINWKKITPRAPNNNFFEENMEEKDNYLRGISIKKLFCVSGTGVLTKRDSLCVQFTKESAFEAALDIVKLPKDEFIEKYHIPADVRDWKYEWAKRDIINSGLNKEKVLPITYRPFDIRYVYYTGLSRGFMGWPVHAVMQHLINEKDNIALVTARSNKAGNCTHFYVSRNIVEYKCGERTTNSSVFPLFLKEDGRLEKIPNFNYDELKRISAILGLEMSLNQHDEAKYFSPMDLFNYIYAMMYSPLFRKKNKEFLNSDFPIIPYPRTQQIFWKLVKLGKELVELHLREMQINIVNISFIGEDRLIKKIDYQKDKVYINKTSYFIGVTKEIWEFLIGGYQPAHRWLNERKGRILSMEDINCYNQIINILVRTNQIMNQIDISYME